MRIVARISVNNKSTTGGPAGTGPAFNESSVKMLFNFFRCPLTIAAAARVTIKSGAI